MKTMIAVLALALTVAAGCGGGEAQEARTTSYAPGAACPDMLEGAHVSVRDTDEGVAMMFTTDGTENAVADLRQRVRAMALLFSGDEQAEMPGAIGSVVDVADGARLELSVTDPDNLASLRRQASIMAEDIRDRRACLTMPPEEAPV